MKIDPIHDDLLASAGFDVSSKSSEKLISKIQRILSEKQRIIQALLIKLIGM